MYQQPTLEPTAKEATEDVLKHLSEMINTLSDKIDTLTFSMRQVFMRLDKSLYYVHIPSDNKSTAESSDMSLSPGIIKDGAALNTYKSADLPLAHASYLDTLFSEMSSDASIPPYTKQELSDTVMSDTEGKKRCTYSTSLMRKFAEDAYLKLNKDLSEVPTHVKNYIARAVSVAEAEATMIIPTYLHLKPDLVDRAWNDKNMKNDQMALILSLERLTQGILPLANCVDHWGAKMMLGRYWNRFSKNIHQKVEEYSSDANEPKLETAAHDEIQNTSGITLPPLSSYDVFAFSSDSSSLYTELNCFTPSSSGYPNPVNQNQPTEDTGERADSGKRKRTK